MLFQGDLETIKNGLLQPCRKHRILEKNHIPLWSPSVFRGTRSGKNAQFISFLVYDLDDGLTPYDSWRLFTKWKVLAHTSFSHKPQFHKYRIILPLAKPIPADEWSRAFRAGNILWEEVVGRGEPDQKAIKDIARIYFRYAIPDWGEFNDVANEHPMNVTSIHQSDSWLKGDLLDLPWESIPKIEPKIYQAPRRESGKKASLEEVTLDPSVRSKLADQTGGVIIDNTARKITCPQCHDNSVYFTINLASPNSVKYPQCNHKNSCGWWGKIQDLL